MPANYRGKNANKLFSMFIAPLINQFIQIVDYELKGREAIKIALDLAFGETIRTARTFELTKEIRPFPGDFVPQTRQQVRREFPEGAVLVAVMDKRTPDMISVSVFDERMSEEEWCFRLRPHQLAAIMPRLKELYYGKSKEEENNSSRYRD